MASLNDTTMTIRVNSTVKKQAQELFSDLGLDMSTAINIFLKRSVSEDRIPFELSRTEKPNLKTRKAMARAEKGENLIGPFKTVEEAMDYLNATHSTSRQNGDAFGFVLKLAPSSEDTVVDLQESK